MASFPGIFTAVVIVETIVKENNSVIQTAYILAFLIFIIYPL